MLALRLLGAAHALALTGQAPRPGRVLPVGGGTARPGPAGADAWAALRQTLAEHRSSIRAWLRRPPQTNEVGRAAALLGGLRYLTAEAGLPVRLVEVGASAGLNLRADHFRVAGDCGHCGPGLVAGGAGGRLAGRQPARGPGRDRSHRTGGDLDPIDPATPEGGLILTAFVWPDQQARLERLRGRARGGPCRSPADLRRESATATLARTELADGTWTVLWHSILRQYLDQAQRAELAEGAAALGAAATPLGPVRLPVPGAVPRRRLPGNADHLARRPQAGPGRGPAARPAGRPGSPG